MRLVGLYGSGHRDKRGSAGRVGLVWVRPLRQVWCLSGVLDCLGPAVLTGKRCLLNVLDYLGPAVETVLVSVGRIGLFRSGLVDRQRVSKRRVGLYGSSHEDKGGLLGVLDLYGSGR